MELTKMDNLPTTDLLSIMDDKKNLSLNLMFNDALFQRTRTIASMMANAEGTTPQHLIGKNETCFAVVTRALQWGLDPLLVATSTYDVKGKFGYEGKLCRAILEKSGRFEDRLKYERIGDWSKVAGKFNIVNRGKGDFANPTYTKEDEEGLGVKITYQVVGEDQKTFEFYLSQAFPRNSTLWATDPYIQLCYTATRRFASLEVPDIFMGISFDKENVDLVDVTPAKKYNGTYDKSGGQDNDINEIIKKNTSNNIHEEPEEPTPEVTGNEVEAESKEPETSDKEESKQAFNESASQQKAKQIITDLKEAKNKDMARAVYNDNAMHILMLEPDSQTEIENLFQDIMSKD